MAAGILAWRSNIYIIYINIVYSNKRHLKIHHLEVVSGCHFPSPCLITPKIIIKIRNWSWGDGCSILDPSSIDKLNFVLIIIESTYFDL